jgi:hypothetical protein
MPTKIPKGSLPLEGVAVAASPGNKFTRVHLDLADDGVTLAMVGAASALKQIDARHSVVLKPTAEGVSLAMVGAASSVR